MAEPLIRFENVRKAFGEKVVLDGVSLDIPQNAITAIIGKSGTGKSVLVKHAIGLLKPDAGEIFFQGQPYSRMSRAQFGEVKRRLSYMFQNNALFDSLSVFENIELPLRERGEGTPKERAARVLEVCEQLDIASAIDQYPKALSGGMQKRVALARALVTRPEVIFFDEPTTGLDPLRKNTVLTMIAQYHARLGFTAVIITHDVPDIFFVAQAVRILDGGHVIFAGTPLELEAQAQPSLRPYLDGQGILTEELTGLGNRPAFIAQTQEVQEQPDMWLVTIRLHGLREIRDYRGQVAAFSCLQEAAHALQKSPLGKRGVFRVGPESLACLTHAPRATEEDLVRQVALILGACPTASTLGTLSGRRRLTFVAAAAPLRADTHPLVQIHNALTTARGISS
ncbi:MAG: phospholipid/cholesterol/gamma-HCH transport system ATP-binding protein [Desulfomicrobiaceae bacterium]|jgi:phospholipid/cholesterol/gamma-HCH transport system ATP-binding protein|nr:phospholipid/cholesterol/gamma-HCH transport system ATP-binding protein [Desulfomicrobiaceae bacterium]